MIGTRLLELRRSRELSLRDLGAATGLSATLLSQIERGVTQPSLKTLRLLADYFGQSIATLFQDDSSLEVAEVTRPEERQVITASVGEVEYRRIAHGNGRLEVLQGHLEPGATSGDEPRSHDAVECAYVLSGELTAQVGDEVFTLSAGEAVTVNSLKPHRYLNLTDTVTDYILSVTPPTP